MLLPESGSQQLGRTGVCGLSGRDQELLERAQAVKSWLEIAGSCDCQTVDVCGLFVDPALAPPAGDVTLDISRIKGRVPQGA